MNIGELLQCSRVDIPQDILSVVMLAKRIVRLSYSASLLQIAFMNIDELFIFDIQQCISSLYFAFTDIVEVVHQWSWVDRPTLSMVMCIREGGILRFGLNRGLPLQPRNPYPCLRVILAERGTHFYGFLSKYRPIFQNFWRKFWKLHIAEVDGKILVVSSM